MGAEGGVGGRRIQRWRPDGLSLSLHAYMYSPRLDDLTDLFRVLPLIEGVQVGDGEGGAWVGVLRGRAGQGREKDRTEAGVVALRVPPWFLQCGVRWSEIDACMRAAEIVCLLCFSPNTSTHCTWIVICGWRHLRSGRHTGGRNAWHVILTSLRTDAVLVD